MVHHLTRKQEIEIEDERMRANTVAPEVVGTSVYETFLNPEQVKELLQTFTAFDPL